MIWSPLGVNFLEAISSNRFPPATVIAKPITNCIS